MIERQFTADRLNEIANDASVYPWVCGPLTGPLDLSPVVADRNNFALVGAHGAVLFVRHQGGLYEAHTVVLPSGRGAWAVMLARAVAQWMFCHTDAVELLTRVPKGNLAARALTRAVGSTFEFTNPRGWTLHGKVVPADIYAMRIQDWMRDAPGLPERGVWFHDELEKEYARVGKTEPRHPDDATHDRYVGAAVAMISGGQPHKAVIFYNRWAVMAGYAPIAVVSTNPITIDIHDALIVARPNNFWIIPCQ